MPTFRRSRRAAGAVLAAGLVLVACQPGDGETTTTTRPETTTTTVQETTTTTEPEPFVYRVGLTSPLTTDNFWAYFDPQSTLADQYVLGPTKPSLYAYRQPGLELAADVAADPEPPEPVEEGDGTWTVTVDLRSDAHWSDGAQITAQDVVFTYETVRDFGLARGWSTAYPVAAEDSEAPGLTGVEAVDRDTVRFRFSSAPGLPHWPNGPGTAPIMPRHHWEDIVAEARAADDPEAALLAASGEGDPSGGPFVVAERSDAEVVAAPNTRFHRSGEEVRSGGVEYVVGPFFDELRFVVFQDQRDALAGLAESQVDVILSPGGLDRVGAAFASGERGVETIANETNSFRYLAFNLRRTPMISRAFRQAVDLMIDRRFVVDQMLQGDAFPLHTTVSPANPRWYDAEAAAEIAASTEELTPEERVARAVEVLAGAGFDWERRPAYEDNVVTPGQGVTLDGEPVRPLEILAPGASIDPQRATYALWIEEWIEQLGFQVDVVMSDFPNLVQRVFTPTPGGDDIDFDMYVLGWRLPGPGIPLYHGSFWAAANDTLRNGGNNNTGFNDDRFNAFAAEFTSAATFEDAFDLVWEMERVLAEEMPYLVLFDTGITEAYRSDRVAYPFTDLLGGLQLVAGLPEAVAPVRS